MEVKNLLKKRKPKVVFSSKNPNVNVIGMQNITIEEKDKRFSFGLQAGYGMTMKGFSPYIGFGGNFNLTR